MCGACDVSCKYSLDMEVLEPLNAMRIQCVEDGHRRLFDPPKEFRRGTYGIYQPPRDVLKSIPGLKLYEMHRTKEYAWCCGAGGGA